MTKSGPLRPFWLNPKDKTTFPDVELALTEPDGLLAVGGDLSVERLCSAYRHGIFPWYSDGQPILWWTPNPRMVLFLDAIKISRSLKKSLKRDDYTVTFDKAFEQVIYACAKPRADDMGTWITQEMANAYLRMFRLGHAHSVEVWHNNELVGGLYGISIGQVFFGESMFSRKTDASKIALVYLVKQLQRWQFAFIDCQIYSSHLASLGARPISRQQFTKYLDIYCEKPTPPAPWQCSITPNDIVN